jgi:hypothetical protein
LLFFNYPKNLFFKNFPHIDNKSSVISQSPSWSRKLVKIFLFSVSPCKSEPIFKPPAFASHNFPIIIGAKTFSKPPACSESIPAFLATAFAIFSCEFHKICPKIPAPSPESGFPASFQIIHISPLSSLACFSTALLIASAPSLLSAFFESPHIIIGKADIIAVLAEPLSIPIFLEISSIIPSFIAPVTKLVKSIFYFFIN